jgi:hypothetical protein
LLYQLSYLPAGFDSNLTEKTSIARKLKTNPASKAPRLYISGFLPRRVKSSHNGYFIHGLETA